MRRTGYVTDIPYTYGHHPEMAPARLVNALLLAGIAPPDALLRGEGFTWCELGFGHGVTLATLAAADPGSRFIGTDLLPAHVDFAAGLAAEAGLSNLSVAAQDFAAFAARPDLPPLDVVALHGVWSWVGPRERSAILSLLCDRLKSGGVCLVSYNALPAHAPLVPLRDLLKRFVDAGAGPLPDRIRVAVDQALALRAAGARFFTANPAAAERLHAMIGRPAAYLAHEYFNEHWAPAAVTDMAAAMATAGLTFAGPVRAADRLDLPTDGPLAAGLAAILAATDDPLEREFRADHLLNRPFRRDLFVKDPVPLDPGARHAALAALRFAPLTAARRLPGGGEVAHGRARFDRAAAVDLVERLALAPGPAGDLALPLTALGHLAPVPPGAPEVRRAACARFNAVVMDRARAGDTVGALASPALGAGVDVDRVERLFLAALRGGADPAADAAAVLDAEGGLPCDGRMLTGGALQAEFADRWAAFRADRLPVLAALGVVQDRDGATRR